MNCGGQIKVRWSRSRKFILFSGHFGIASFKSPVASVANPPAIQADPHRRIGIHLSSHGPMVEQSRGDYSPGSQQQVQLEFKTLLLNSDVIIKQLLFRKTCYNEEIVNDFGSIFSRAQMSTSLTTQLQVVGSSDSSLLKPATSPKILSASLC